MAAIPVIVMTAHSDLESAVSYLQGGDDLPKPFDIDEAVNIVKRANDTSPSTITPSAELLPEAQRYYGEAPAMQEVFPRHRALAHSPITV